MQFKKRERERFTLNSLNSFQQQLYGFYQVRNYCYPKERREEKKRRKKVEEDRKSLRIKRLSELRNRVANSLFVLSKIF